MNPELISLVISCVVIGVGATLIMDIWALLLKRVFTIKPLNYGLVGRWVLYMPKGLFRHDSIIDKKPVKTELLVGWITHYLVGIVFAATMIISCGYDWLIEPSVLCAICFGLLTNIFPFFIMQPAMGLGFAASKTPQPNLARFRSLLTHCIFGFGLYVFAKLMSMYFIHSS
jgi:hypothetical protein